MPDTGLQPPYLDPSQYPAYLDLQRKQQIAQMLVGASQQATQTPAEWNSMRVVPKRSPLSNVTALATALMAGKAMKSANQAQQDYFTGLMSPGATPTASTPSAPSAVSSASAGIPAAPQASPTSGIMAPQNPMIPSGMAPSTAQGILQMMGPEKYAENFIAPQFKLPEIVTQLKAAGIDPNSALGRQIQQNAIAKATYMEPLNVREGSTLVDPTTMQPTFEAPKEGIGIKYGPNGPQAYEVPGYRQATAGIEGAQTGAKQGNTIMIVPSQGGGSTVGYGSQLAGQAPALGGAQAPRVAAPGSAGGGSGFAPAAEPGEAPVWQSVPMLKVPRGIGAPGDYTAAMLKGAGDKANELYTKYGQEADLADQKIALNEQAMKELSSAELGPLSDTLTKYRGTLKELGVPDSLIGGDSVTPTQELRKYLVNNAIQGARQLYGNRMTQQEVQMQKEESNPSDKMTLQAVQDLVKFQNIQNQYAKQRALDYDKYVQRGGDPRRFESWYATNFPLSKAAHQPTLEELQAEARKRGLIP